MANTPTLAKAKAAAAPVAAQPTAVAAEAAVPPVAVEGEVEASVAEGGEPPVDDTRARLAQLFAHLKITKIVFVDDKAELETDAGAVIKALAAKEAAKEPLADFFPGVALTLENDALQEQVTARLGELDAEGWPPFAEYWPPRAMMPPSVRH